MTAKCRIEGTLHGMNRVRVCYVTCTRRSKAAVLCLTPSWVEWSCSLAVCSSSVLRSSCTDTLNQSTRMRSQSTRMLNQAVALFLDSSRAQCPRLGLGLLAQLLTSRLITCTVSSSTLLFPSVTLNCSDSWPLWCSASSRLFR